MLYFIFSINPSKNHENSIAVSTKILILLLENQHIGEISEGCDIEDWSNDAENSALSSQE